MLDLAALYRQDVWSLSLALIKQGIRSGLCGADVQILTEMVDLADDALFQRIFIQFQPRYTHSYPISTRQDTSQTSTPRQFYLHLTGTLQINKFLLRQLYKDAY